MGPVIKAATQKIAPDVHFGNNVQFAAQTVTIGASVTIGDNVKIEGREILIEAGAKIQNDVTIFADSFSLGYRSCIEHSCKLMALGGQAQEIRFGDNCLFAAFNSALVPVLLVGDYVKIHNHTLISGYRPCYIGHNSWIGQNCVLNSNDVLFIGNNVGIGTYSSIWTHAFFGELLEGFTVFNVAPTIIEDDVWIVGAYNVISPGLTVGSRSMILTSSVVSKNIPPEHTVAGVPARDLTDKLPPVRSMSINEKIEMILKFVHEFVETVYPRHYTVINDGYLVTPEKEVHFHILVREEFSDGEYDDAAPVLLYVRSNQSQREYKNITVFDLTTKQYTKRRTDPEIQIISFMNGYRARFVPKTNPHVGIKPATGAQEQA